MNFYLESFVAAVEGYERTRLIFFFYEDGGGVERYFTFTVNFNPPLTSLSQTHVRIKFLIESSTRKRMASFFLKDFSVIGQ